MKFIPLDVRSSAFVIGILLLILSAFMVIPLGVGLYYHEPHVDGFAKAFMGSFFVGGLLILAYRSNEMSHLQIRTAFFLTSAAWITLGLFGAFPFILSNHASSFSSAVLESISALTTTGLSSITSFQETPTYILVWRGLLQWLGGIGITLMAITLLPFLRIGGMQLFATESSSHYEKIFPKISQVTKFLLCLYTAMTAFCILCLWSSGMPPLKAFCYGLSTISTSGMAMVIDGFNYGADPFVPWILIFFMIMSASPLLLLVKFFMGSWHVYVHDSQVNAYFKTMFIASFITIILSVLSAQIFDWTMIKSSIFQTVSMVTTSGFNDGSPQKWSIGVRIFLICLCVIGGCTGSTSGGIKIFRFQIIYRIIQAQIYKMILPHGVFTPIYQKKAVDTYTVYSVLSIIVLFVVLFCLFAIGFTLFGITVPQSFELSASILSNCGTQFTALPIEHFGIELKWMMIAGMLLGRLEFLTILILFVPAFWRR